MKILAGAVALISLVAVHPAQAQEAPTAGHGSAGVLLGNAFKDGLNIGIGARGGYTLPMNLYIGGTFVYHLGNSTSTPFGDVKVNAYYFGAEVGYDLAAGPVVIRPYGGLGYATFIIKTPAIDLGQFGSVPGTSASTSKFAFWPGATLLYPLGGAFIGADARFLLITDSKDANGDSLNAFSLFATAGLQF
jgi:hypothetical protein